jgi:hypothetical protein
LNDVGRVDLSDVVAADVDVYLIDHSDIHGDGADSDSYRRLHELARRKLLRQLGIQLMHG